MGLVGTWLSGCGLSHAIPNFTAAGIVTPAALAELDLAHYEALGVSSPDDRRKLFYLVQRIKLAVKKEGDHKKEPASTSTTTPATTTKPVVEQGGAVIQSTTTAVTAKQDDQATGDEVLLGLEQSQSHGESTHQTPTKMATPTEQKPPAKSSSPSKIGRAPSNNDNNNNKRSPSKLTPPRATAVQVAAPNKKQLSTAKMATCPGETTTPTKSPRHDNNNNKKPALQLASSNRANSMEMDGSTDECADDEASTDVRRSKRIAKPPSAKTTVHKPAKPQPAPPKAVATSRRASSGLKTPQPKSKASMHQNQQNRSNNNMVAPSRLQSKLQNPSKSMRTGKQLSTIPSDDILPMSPMIPPQLEATNKQKKPNLVKPKKLSLSRHRSVGGNVSDSDASDTESVGGSSRRGYSRSRRTSVDGIRLNRSRGESLSDSDSSVNSSKRRRSMALPTTKPKMAKGRVSDGVSTSRQASTRNMRTSGHSVMQTKKASESKGKGMSIHGSGGSEFDASWKAQIEALKQEVAMEHELFSDALFQEDDDDDQMIRVIVRKRPFNRQKSSDIDVIHPLEYGYYGKMLVYQPMTRVDLTKEVNKIPFAYDTVFGEESDNAQIYDKSVRNMIPVVLDGQHATVFAFGATGSGKTHTMMGSGFTSSKVVEDKNMGLYYMAALDVFSCLEESEYSHLSVGVSLFEIYGGKLFDLLNNRKTVKCLEDHKGKVNFPGLSEHGIDGPGELIELIELGAQSRSTGTTSRNADSSRSHAVLQLHLRKTVGRKSNVEHGRLTFIDLAGSERGADTANFSRATRLEGAEINTSLLALKEVIRARARGGTMVHVPFRGSKLTQVLKESFVGENSRCLMISCIAPDMESVETTLNTLRYADRVKERNPETGDLPAKFTKRGGRRRTSMLKSSASVSSIVSTSDQSMPATYDKRTKNIGTAAMKSVDRDDFSEDSFSDSRSSIKESGPETVRKSKMKWPKPEVAKHDSYATTGDELVSSALSEDDTDALLDAVLSEDASSLVADNEVTQANSLVDELVATHDSFLNAVMGMVQDEIDILETLKKADRGGVDRYSGQLESMLQNQRSLISDLRECFQTYESISIGEQLQSHRTVLTALLDIVKEQLSLAKALNGESEQLGDLVEQLEALQESKISQISVLQEGFSSGPQALECKGSSDTLLSESFKSEGDDNDDDDDFEDLRV